MTFLAPWAALTAAAIAAPVLLALYMLKLRRRPVVVSATAFWEQALRDLEVNVPLRWIRPSWLLALQALALALLIAALGRPALEGGGEAASHVVLIIDRSASMRACDAEAPGGGSVTRFDAVVDLARARLDRLARTGFSGDVTILAFGASASRVAGPTSDLRLAREALGRLEPTHETGAPAAAFDLARALLAADSDAPADAELQASRASIVLYSDTWPPEALAAPVPVRFERVGPPPDPQGLVASDNAGIVALAARRGFDDPGVVRVFVRLVAVGGARAVPIVLSIDDDEIERRAVSLTPLVDGSAALREASAVFEIERTEAGVIGVRIDRPDALDADNSAAVVVRAAAKPSIVLIQPTDDLPPSEGGWILVEVLRELRPGALVSMSAPRFDELGPAAWSGADVLVLLGATPRTPPPRATLSFGAPPALPGLQPRPRADANAGFVSWSRDHPLLRSVTLDAVRFRGGLALDTPADGAAEWERVADAPGGTAIVAGEHDGHRHVVVGFELAHTNWPVHVSFPLFVANAIEWLTLSGDAEAGGSFRAGEPIELPLGALPASGPSEPGTEGVELTREGGGSVRVRPMRAGARAALGTLPRAGVYSVEGSGARLAVNVASEVESAIAVSEPPTVGRASAGAVASAGPGDEPRELWPWCVLMAAALAMAEWVLSALRMRA